MCLVLVVCEAYVGTALQDLFVVVCMSFFELGNWLSWDGFRLFWVQENGGFGKLQDEYKNDYLMRS